jgi:exonuclease III
MTLNPINHFSLSIFLWNANGLKQHSNELFYFIHNKNIDIALITETHISKSVNIKFNGYLTIRADHPNGASRGGSAIIIKSSLFYSQMKNISKKKL